MQSTAAKPNPAVSLREVLREPRRFWLIVIIQVALGSVLTGVLLWGPTLVAQVFECLSATGRHLLRRHQHLRAAGARRLHVAATPDRPRALRACWWGIAVPPRCCWRCVLRDAYWAGVPLLFLCLVVGQFFYDGGYSNLTTYAAELYPVRSVRAAMGVSAGAAGIGKILGPAGDGTDGRRRTISCRRP